MLRSTQRVSTKFIRMTKRYTGSYQSGAEGATAQSGSFGQKEKAIENQWARSHDAEKIKILREALAKQEQETASIKKNLADLEKKVSK